jgi:hypothetical protein
MGPGGEGFAEQAGGVVVHDAGGELVDRVEGRRADDDMRRRREALGLVGSALPGQDRVSGDLLGSGLVQPGEGCSRGDDADEPAGFDRGGGYLGHPSGQRGAAGNQREVVGHRSVQGARADTALDLRQPRLRPANAAWLNPRRRRYTAIRSPVPADAIA